MTSTADRRALGILSLAHIANDINQSALPSMLPFIMAQRHLSLASVASLVLAANLSSSIVQPLFGHFGDRRSMWWILPVALMVATSGIVIVGLAEPLWLMFLGAFISGIGVAAFHPEGARFANYASTNRPGTGMSFFTVGGYIGFALGPILVTPIMLGLGPHGLAWLLIPATIFAAALCYEIPRFAKHHHARLETSPKIVRVDDWRAFALLSSTVMVRSIAFIGIVTFVPLFLIHAFGADKAYANGMLAVVLTLGAFGTVLGGRLGDRFSRRTIMRASLVSVGISAWLAAWLAHAGAPLLAVDMVLAFLGFMLSLSASVGVVLGQEYLPNRVGTASGMTLGLAVTVGGLAAPVLGTIGDHTGLMWVMFAIGVAALAAFTLSTQLKEPSTHATMLDKEEANLTVA